ncbi:glycosyltransferase family 39 protein, partial [Candidatus Curtissbacteria bacterium]|nr:glycosyltransferase family 39 protein [Candidatus Curtissbacteria bacterium]
YNIDKLTTFGGDQGYDFAQVRNIIVEKKPTLLGPKVGPYDKFGNLYLGPAYYYLLLPSLVLSNFDPIGPALFTASIAVLTVLVVYKIALEFLNKQIAIISSSFYALNPFLIEQSRAASNPHLTPFFSALTVLALFKIIRGKSKKNIWPLTIGFCCAVVVQLHYLGLTLFIVSFFALVLKSPRSLVKFFLSFAITLSPQIIFEMRHQFFITNLIIKAFTNSNNISLPLSIWNHITTIVLKVNDAINGPNMIILIILAIAALTVFCFKNREKLDILLILFSLTLTTLLAAALFSGPTQLHYLVVAYPAYFLLVATGIYQLIIISKNYLYRFIFGFVIVELLTQNVMAINLFSNQGYTMPEGLNQALIRKTSKIISEDAKNVKSFNIANTLDGDTRAMPYRYLVSAYGSIPEAVENYPNVQVLYVVTRDDNSKVLEYTVWEISSFQPFKFAKNWNMENGIRLLKLEKVSDEKK